MSSPTEPMPTGTVTFLLTDVEGSTRSWAANPDRTKHAIVRHYELLDQVMAAHSGFRPVEQGEGDSSVTAFARPTDAVAAALAAQRRLVDEVGDAIAVRMALHTGETDEHAGTYLGQTIARTARLRALAHGGQILVSGTTAAMVADQVPDGAWLIGLGCHQLRDLDRPEDVFQLSAEDLPSRFPPLASADRVATNLPAALDPLVGRVAELAAITGLLGDPGRRIVTLTGPGGVGKTRLAQQIAADVIDAFPDGVWWVELAPIVAGARVAEAIALAMGVPETAMVSAVSQVVIALGDHRALVVLDNCEHVLDVCAQLADEVLRSCPAVTVLATSREPLGIAAESVWHVPSLFVPHEDVDLPALASADGVRLFVDRAQRARAGFELNANNATAVAEICRRLDGIPLALELAASRLRVAPVDRVAAELHDRFRVLTGGARTAVPRHQTLRASVEWSHDLLNEAEQALLRRLSVFVASFTIEAAEFVAAAGDLDPYEVPSLVGRLVDKSLVQLDLANGRYRMLETIRQYALDRCSEAGELEELGDHHVRWIVASLESVDHDLCAGPVYRSLEVEYPNIRSALEWALDHDLDAAIRIVDGIATFWGLSGRHRDTFGLGGRVLEASRTADPARWAVLVSLVSWVRISAGDVEFIADQTTAALRMAQDIGDFASQARCLYGLGLADCGDTSMFEPVHQLAVQAGNGRYAAYGALLATGSQLGTEDATPLLERATRLATDFDDDTYHLALTGWVALHLALKGEQAAAANVARDALRHQSRAVAAEFTVIAGAMHVALQGNDTELLRSAQQHIPPELRDLPGSEWWVQLLDDTAALREADRPTSTLAVPPPLMLILLVSDLVVRVLMCADRLADAQRWVQQIPTSWPTAHSSATLARAWIAHANADPALADQIHDALSEATVCGLRPFITEALELLALHLTTADHPSEAARLLGAAGAERERMDIAWRYPYHQAGVDEAHQRARHALGHDRFDHTYEDGANANLEEIIQFAQRMRGRRSRPAHGWASLTPTEIAVAEEIAAGHTNTQAAAKLYIAPSTVKSHLERIYRKLGIHGRAALAAEVEKQRAATEIGT